jgi:hypothetical protein
MKLLFSICSVSAYPARFGVISLTLNDFTDSKSSKSLPERLLSAMTLGDDVLTFVGDGIDT